jgi:chromosome segregation ATPase
MRRDLERRLAELSAQIRHYPTPIARCDEQLADLIEQRTRVLEQLKQLDEVALQRPFCVWTNDGGFDGA